MPPEIERGLQLSRHIGTWMARSDDATVSAWLPARPDLLDDDDASVRPGVLAFLVDTAGGMASGLAVWPEWVLTADLTLNLGGAATVGPVRADATILRAGRSTAVAEVTLHDEGRGVVIGSGTVGSAVRTPPFDPPDLEEALERRSFDLDEVMAPRQPLESWLGVGPAEGPPGSVELELDDALRNPWGILHGGAHTMILDSAAGRAATDALGRPARVAAMAVRYLKPGELGPIAAVPAVLGVEGDRAVLRVGLHDRGSENRLLSVAEVTVVARGS